jgi:undecaprenyl-diphosphatase
MDIILSVDTQLFYFLNRLPHNPVTDNLAVFFSGIGSYALVWFVLGIGLIYREERRDHWFFLPLSLTALLSFFLTEWFLKPAIGRPRPQFLLDTYLVTGMFLDSRSFPSGHATTAFALAYLLSQKEPRFRSAFYLLAILIALSRVFLGYHYPLDIFAGALLGSLIGFVASLCFRLLRPAKSGKLL